MKTYGLTNFLNLPFYTYFTCI